MKLGVAMFITDYSMTPQELAVAAEQRGFDSVWSPEHSHIPLSRKSAFPSGGDLPKKYYDAMDPFVALTMYMQLAEGFGWDMYKKVFAEYNGLKKEERPKSDDEKRDQWMVRFSKACGKNLGPFFQAWGVPTSSAARDSIKDLPAWMPEGFGTQPAK